jgi:hypothetical protein
MTKIAVVITCFNKEQYIKDAILSALENTSDVIVVDDHSADSSWQIISEFKNVTKIQKKINVGVTAATISGVNCAIKQGFEYVALLDGDDVLAPGSLDHYSRLIHEFSVDAIYSIGARDGNSKTDFRSKVQRVDPGADFTLIEDPLSFYLQNFPAGTTVCSRCDILLKDLNPKARIQDHQIAFSIHLNGTVIAKSTAVTHFISAPVEGQNLVLNTPEKALSAVRTYASHWQLVQDHPLGHRMRNRAFSQLLRLITTRHLPLKFRIGLIRYSPIHQLLSAERKHSILLSAAHITS